MEKKLDGNYTRMLWAVLNKSWSQHSTKQQLYSHLTPITKTIEVRQTKHAGHCWRSKDELISDILKWTSSHGRVKAGQPTRTYIQQLCADTGCSLEDLPGAWTIETRGKRGSGRSVLAARNSLHNVFLDQKALKLTIHKAKEKPKKYIRSAIERLVFMIPLKLINIFCLLYQRQMEWLAGWEDILFQGRQIF